MYRFGIIEKTKLRVNKSDYGETIEQKIQRITSNKEPIKDGAPMIYTDRSSGVQPEYDIRTDRFDLAVENMDKVTKSKLAAREQRHAKVVEMNKKEDISEAKSTQGTTPDTGDIK